MGSYLIREITVIFEDNGEYVVVSHSVCKKPSNQKTLLVERQSKKQNNSVGKKKATSVKNKSNVCKRLLIVNIPWSCVCLWVICVILNTRPVS